MTVADSARLSPVALERAFRAYREDCERSPWGRYLLEMLATEVRPYVLTADGKLEPLEHPPAVLVALDKHRDYCIEAAQRHGLDWWPLP